MAEPQNTPATPEKRAPAKKKAAEPAPAAKSTEAERTAEVPILSRLKPPVGAVQSRKRIGRGPGSGLGKTAGKGQKGQKARAGGGVRPGFEGGQMPLHRRLPKVGFKNPFSKNIVTVNVGRLSRFEEGAEVDPAVLVEARLIDRNHDGVKILGEGKLEHPLTVKAHAFSKGARTLIEAAGGTVVVLETRTPAPVKRRSKKAAKDASTT